MMKKIFALVFILVLGKMSYSQTYPLQQNLGSDSTIVISKGALQSRLAPIVISDTTAANNQRIKNYPGAQLYTANGDFYVRNATATKWVLVSSGSSGPINIYNSDGTLTGNRVLTGAGNSLTFSGISGLGINKVADSVFTVEGGIHATGGLRLENLASSPGTKALRIDGQGVVSVADTSGGTVTSIATNNGTGITGGTITSTGTLAIDTTIISTRAWRQKGIDSVVNLPRVTSVGLTMPVAFNVAGSPVTNSGTLAVTAAGLSTQYIRGDGQLANFPGGGGGGGSSVVYYFNGGTNQGTFVGNTYYEMSKTAIVGTAANFTINADGYITQFITDAGDPALLNIPAGNWNFEMYFSASSGGGSPSFYVELYKYDGTTFTLISSSSSSPEGITGGTATDLYLTALAVPATSLTLTDRLAVRVYVTHSGRTITLHTQDNTLCQVTTTFTTGITALNGLTEQVQYFATGTSGTDFAISSASATHTFNLPTASATNRGALSSSDWTTFNSKISPSDTASMLAPYLRKADTTAMLANYVNNVGYGLSKAGQVVSADSSTLANYFLRRKDSLTSTNLLGYVTRTILADTAAAIRSADAGGTVTSVATNNGTGITGGTFTTSGTIAADTLILSTRAWRQKGVDSLQANINLKLNISDTASMLIPYLRKIDTASLSNRINTKLNISDTSSMLTNYINDVGYGLLKTSQVARADSATLANYFLRRKDSLTSTNLLGYITRTVLADSAAAIRAAAGSVGGSGTTNRVSKFTASGTIGNSSIADSSSSVAMTILSNGNIGINTTAPNERLEIVGTSRFTRTTSPSVYLNISMENGFAEYDARGSIDHVWENGGVENMRLALGGNLGIGTASPDSMLTVLQGARFQRGVRMSGLPSAPGTRALRIDANGTLSVADTTTGGGGGIGGSGTTNRIAKFTASGTIGNSSIADSSSSVAMTISSAGAVIFTDTVRINTTSTKGLVLQNSAGGESPNITFNTPVNKYNIDANAVGNLRLFTEKTDGTGGVVRATLDSSGNLGLGTTTIGSRLQVNGNAAIGYSASTAAPTNGLAVAGGITSGAYIAALGARISSAPSAQGVYLGNSGTTSTDYATIEIVGGSAGGGEIDFTSPSVDIKGRIGYNNSSDFMQFLTNGTEKLRISSGGSVFVGNGETASSPSTGIISGTGGTGTNIAGAEFRIRGGASTGSAAGGPITFYTSAAGSAGTGTNAATERMRIDADGNVGIGATSPSRYGAGGTARFLEIYNTGTAANSQAHLVLSSGATTNIGAIGSIMFALPNSGTSDKRAAFIQAEMEASGATTNANLRFYTTLSGSFTNNLYLKPGGGVGIGTITVGSTLQVNGNAAIGYSASTAAPTNGLAVAGNVGIGVTSTTIRLDVSSAAAEVMRLRGTNGGSTNNTQLRFYGSNSAADLWAIGTEVSTGTTGRAFDFYDVVSAANRLRIDASGNVGIATNTIGSRLQVNGNAAIGYSASTAAPTNGLAVSGDVAIGTNTAVTRLDTRISAADGVNGTVLNSYPIASFIVNGAGGGSRGLQVGGPTSGVSSPVFLKVSGTSQRMAFVDNNNRENVTISEGGNTGFGTTTIGSVVQVNGNAAIGYSASTAAPTNGLSISGNTTIGTTTAAGKFTIDPDDNQVGLAITGTSLTGSNAQSLIDLAQTWNTTGNPAAIKLNITNTASGASAYLMDLQVGSATQFRVTKAGAIRTAAPTSGTANDWKLGSVVGGTTVLDTTQWLEVEVGGTLYRVALVTLPEPEPGATPASTPEDRKISEPVKTSSQRIQELENEIQELRKMVNFLMPTSKNKK